MEWKCKIEDECCADELEEMIINYIKAGFLSDDKIIMECEQYMEDFYCFQCNFLRLFPLHVHTDACSDKA